MISNGSDSSRPPFDRSDQGQVSSIRFVSSIIGNLGAPLHDGSFEDDDEARDNIDVEGVQLPDLSRDDEELHVGISPLIVDIVEENVAGPSKIPVGPRSIESVEAIA